MKNRLHSFVVALALLTADQVMQAQVTNVGIAQSGNRSVLFWRPDPQAYTLMSTTNLNNPNWAVVDNLSPVIAIIVTNSSPQQFFRLQARSNSNLVYIPGGQYILGMPYRDATRNTRTNVWLSPFYS